MSITRFLSSSVAPLQRLRRFELERNPLWWKPGVDHLCASDVEPLDLDGLLRIGGYSIEQLADISLGYPDSQGSYSLRQAVAELYGTEVRAENVTICAPAEGILLAMLSILTPGDAVVVVDPVYQSLRELAEAVGCEIRPWTVSYSRAADGSMSANFCVEDLRGAYIQFQFSI